MEKTQALTAERLRELFTYSKSTGLFARKVAKGRAKAGPLRIKIRPQGYFAVGIDGGLYLLHRLAVLYVTGQWPKGEVDHRNEDKTDNRWRNLRDVPHRSNQQNREKANRNSVLGIPGVSKPNPGGGFRAQISEHGRTKYIGTFPTAEAAAKARRDAKQKLHPGYIRRTA